MDDVSARFWNDIVTRLFEGPFHFRLFLQPAMAAIAAYRDGVNDARHGEPLYLYALLTQPKATRRLIRQGLAHIGRVVAMGAIIDAAYQVIVFRWIYPFELLLVVFLLAVLPYVLLRGVFNIGWRLLHHRRV